MKKRSKIYIIAVAALVSAAMICASLFASRSRTWEDIARDRAPNSLAASLTVNVLNQEGEILQADIWQLTPEQTEGPAADAILAALGSANFKGTPRNLISYTLFKKANSSYTVNRENSKGEVSLLLTDDSHRTMFLTLFSGGMVVLRDHASGTGNLFFSTNPQVYEELSAVVKTYSSSQEG